MRVIIFTEWDDTKNYILAQLQNAIKDPVSAAERLACFHGATSKDQREAIKMAFNASPEADPLRILVATDAAREGLNLQSRCHNLFHFDIPWNPSRMEQRNGRIDRKLQPSPQVFCHYFYYPNRPQDPLLDKIIQKSEVIRRELGSQSQVIDDEIKARIEAGDSLEGAVSVFEARIEDAKKAQKIAMDELECSREVQADLRKRLIELEDVKRKSELHIDINEDRFLRALNSSLDIQRLSKIQPLDATGKRFAFPRLDKDQGASANWFFALDSLRRPKLADESFQEWRRNSPIRPITFTDPGVLDDSLLHMHLGHRLAQRLLGRFVAQGFTADDLSRTCLLPAPDGIPRVALLASVRLFGAGGARLHEEIITVTARWTPIKDRKIALEPYSRDSEKKTMDMIGKLLDDSSAFFKLDAPTEVLSAIGRDARELLVHLGPRAKDASVSAMAALANRGKKELSAMEQHLEERRRRIKETLGSHEQDNSYFVRAFANPIERRQLELNIKHWQKRLAEIDVEIKTEPSKIAAGYEVRARRIEPIGLIYLWPFAKASRGKTS